MIDYTPRDPLVDVLAQEIHDAEGAVDRLVEAARVAARLHGGNRTRAAQSQALVIYNDMEPQQRAAWMAVLLQRHVLALERLGMR